MWNNIDQINNLLGKYKSELLWIIWHFWHNVDWNKENTIDRPEVSKNPMILFDYLTDRHFEYYTSKHPNPAKAGGFFNLI